MRRLARLLLYALLVLFVFALVGIYLLKTKYPKVSSTQQFVVKSSPQLIKRGKYLAYHVAACMDCHSTRNWDLLTGPIIPGTDGKGGEAFTHDYGFPGNFYSKNITPAGISSWTDDQIYRAITSGIDNNGEPIFPVMPYLKYGKMSTDDVAAIIAFIRTLHPIPNDVKESKADFPVNLIMRTSPTDPQPMDKPDSTEIVPHGRYLFTIAACADCHTKQVNGSPVEGMDLAGGFEFKLPGGGIIRSSNLTQDKETGIGNMSKREFIGRFKYYNNPKAQNIPVVGEYNTVMPWTMYSGMSEHDLGAIYEYLQTIDPIANEFERFTSAKETKN